MAKKHSTKRQATQRKLGRKRRVPVNYFEVPRPLWKRIKALLPKPAKVRRAGRPPLPDRLVLNAIWSVLWTGCQWKALSQAQFGVSSSTAHARFQRWCEGGIFTAIMA